MERGAARLHICLRGNSTLPPKGVEGDRGYSLGVGDNMTKLKRQADRCGEI